MNRDEESAKERSGSTPRFQYLEEAQKRGEIETNEVSVNFG